jgi:hypothetical protein
LNDTEVGYDAPGIITDSSLTYAGGIQLESTPEVLKVSRGYSLDTVSGENNDAVSWNEILNRGQILDQYNF